MAVGFILKRVFKMVSGENSGRKVQVAYGMPFRSSREFRNVLGDGVNQIKSTHNTLSKRD